MSPEHSSQLLELTLTRTHIRRVCKARRKAALAAVEHRGAALSEAPEFANDREVRVHRATLTSGPTFFMTDSASGAVRVFDAAPPSVYTSNLDPLPINLPSPPRGSFQIVWAAVSQNGLALRFASEELRAEAAMVWAAVNVAGCALQYASDELRRSKPHVMAAVQQVRLVLQGEGGPSPSALLLRCHDGGVRVPCYCHWPCVQDGEAFRFAASHLREDSDVVSAALAAKASVVKCVAHGHTGARLPPPVFFFLSGRVWPVFSMLTLCFLLEAARALCGLVARSGGQLPSCSISSLPRLLFF